MSACLHTEMSRVSATSPICRKESSINPTLVLNTRKFVASRNAPSSLPAATNASTAFAVKSASARNAGAARKQSKKLLLTPPPVLSLVSDPVEEPKLFKKLLLFPPLAAHLWSRPGNASSRISSHTPMSRIHNQTPSSSKLKLMNGRQHFHAIKNRSRS